MSSPADPSPSGSTQSGSAEAEARRRRGEALPAGLVDAHPARSSGSPGARRAHRQAVADGADGYVDPDTGLFCFTAAYHWAKGACCELGCRHCPWLDADRRLSGGA